MPVSLPSLALLHLAEENGTAQRAKSSWNLLSGFLFTWGSLSSRDTLLPFQLYSCL